eukprot:TRINITY_DN9540_c0_g1_i1.p1 TRINITY_DN9540_c0_g1~~TRINITY_DN9540_c0_g1_i1.p1  ORF type:complete len:408 (-),score=39.76 TRINITY_DN9540_c0_g1_i1:225-1328(-)
MQPPWQTGSSNSDVALAGGSSARSPRNRQRGGYSGTGTKADLDNHANQMNPNNWRYWTSRGMQPPWQAQRCALFGRRMTDTDIEAGHQMVVEQVNGQDNARCLDRCVCSALDDCGLQSTITLDQSISCRDVAVKLCSSTCDAKSASKSLIVFIVAAVSALKWIVVQPIFAAKYKTQIVDERRKLPDSVPGVGFGSTMSQECCSALAAMTCQDDASLCLHACCCHAVRMADTYSSAGLGSFYANFVGLTVLLYLLPCLLTTGGYAPLLCYALCAAIFSTRRGRLRQRLGGSECSFMDFLSLLCCPFCAACQEARQVEQVTSEHVACCCLLMEASEADGTAPLVGEPVVADRGVELAASGQSYMMNDGL